jgi:hypothetical protein
LPTRACFARRAPICLPHGESTSELRGAYEEAIVGCLDSIEGFEEYAGGDERLMMGEEQKGGVGVELYILDNPTLSS